jgi:glycosyltransferase involved in cell wall biosynthesis
MIEAMATGLPVVAHDLGGKREYAQHGRTGFLCADRDEFVRSTRLLLDRPDLLIATGAAARAFVEAHHSLAVLTASVGACINALG